MALDAILSAISAKNDQLLNDERAAHKQTLASLKQAFEDGLSEMQSRVQKQCDQKKLAMMQKAKTHASMHVTNTELTAKQTILNEVYESVVKEFDALSEKDVTAMLQAMLDKLPNEGILHVGKKQEKILKKIASQYTFGNVLDDSGFILETEEADYDCRITTIVNEQMRPSTEISISQELFA